MTSRLSRLMGVALLRLALVDRAALSLVSPVRWAFSPPVDLLVLFLLYMASRHVHVELIDPWCGTSIAEQMVLWKVKIERIAEIYEAAVMPVTLLRFYLRSRRP